MNDKRWRVVAVTALLVVGAALPAGVGAGSRIPVNSTDDPTSSAASRIAAVTNIVDATNARLGRVIVAFPPNPCAGGTEIDPVCLAFIPVLGSYMTLAESVADACAAVPTDGLGDAVITDADAFATDTSTRGLVNQLASIGTVLGNVNDRLGGISLPTPGPADLAALAALAAAVELGGTAAAGVIGYEWPPNPCIPEPGPPV